MLGRAAASKSFRRVENSPKMGGRRKVRSFPRMLPRPIGSGLARFGQIREDSRPRFGFEDRARHPCRVGLVGDGCLNRCCHHATLRGDRSELSRGSEVPRDWVWHPSTLSGDTTTHERSLFQKCNSMTARQIILLASIFSAACGFLSHERSAAADESATSGPTATAAVATQTNCPPVGPCTVLPPVSECHRSVSARRWMFAHPSGRATRPSPVLSGRRTHGFNRVHR